MSDEQKQKKKESNKRYRDNMSDEQKQKLKDWIRFNKIDVFKIRFVLNVFLVFLLSLV